MNRPVRQIQMHSIPFVPSVGNLKNSINEESNPGTVLTAQTHGVDVLYKGTLFTVPWGNIICAVYKPVPVETDKKAK